MPTTKDRAANPADKPPARCRAIVYLATGGPEVIAIRDVATPKPAEGEVLVRVAAAGINRPDILQRQGLYTPAPDNRDRPGLEISGVVAGLGDRARGVALGDRVVALTNGAGIAEYAVAPAGQVLPVPQGWSFTEAATLGENFFTIQQTLVDRAGLSKDMTVLVHGASGGLGATAIQIARARGARVIASISSPQKAEYALSLGADHLVAYNREDFAARTLELTAGRGADRIVDIVGGPALWQNIKAAAPGGTIILLGFLAGAKAEINLAPVLMKGLTLFGSTLTACSAARKAVIADHLECEVWPLLQSGDIRPQRLVTFPFAEAAAAQMAMDDKDQFGRIVLLTDFGATANPP